MGKVRPCPKRRLDGPNRPSMRPFIQIHPSIQTSTFSGQLADSRPVLRGPAQAVGKLGLGQEWNHTK